MNRGTKTVGLLLLGTFAFARLGAADEDHKQKWEEMKKKHEECLKNSGAFDQKTIDTLADCHKTVMKDNKEKSEKGDKDSGKAAVDACLKDKGLTLTQAQQDALKSCHQHHHEK